jgi:hypothetical protein
MDAFYGMNVTNKAVLLGEVAAPAGSRRFIDAVREAKAQAHAAN